MEHYSENEQKKVEQIRHSYGDKRTSKVEQLRQLDSKVRRPGKVIGIGCCVIGLLILGAGMTNVMVYSNMSLGLILGIPGLILAILSFPISQLITNKRKHEYSSQIMRLSQEIVH